MIIVKNLQLDKQTLESINILLELNLPAKVAFHLMRVLKEISSLVDDKILLEKKIVDRFTEKDETGNPVQAVDESGNPIVNTIKITDLAKFNEEIDELNSIENNIPFDKLNFDDLKLETAKVKDLLRLDFLFN
jgi:hypothetical protein